jgi:hypothetical protein
MLRVSVIVPSARSYRERRARILAGEVGSGA